MIRLFRHYVPRALLILAIVEAMILVSSIYVGRSLRVRAWDMPQPELQDVITRALVFTLVMIGIMTAMGLYERHFWNGRADMILRVAVSFFLGLFVMTLIYYMFPDLYLGRGEFGLAFALAFTGVVLVRFGFLHVSNHDMLKRRVLVLGAGAKATQIDRLPGKVTRGIKIVGYVPLPGERDAVDPARILPITTTLPDLTEEQRIDELLLTTADKITGFPVEDILECKISGVQVTDLLTFFERETGKIQLDALQPSSMIFSDGFYQAVLKTTIKRLFDIRAASLLLLFTWPVMVLTALAIWMESGGRGPIFYLQERVGKHECLFRLIKFRSMRVDAEQDGVARWAQANDSRITRVGAVIRRTRIDELPQLFNVLLGQMSFVGPRPERPQFVRELNRTIPFYSMRHRVNPGITGWAQICYPYGASEEDAREKLQYDLYYIKNYSLFLDFVVLLQTAHVILWSKGAR
jgi:sugar transferase (PEP-CTERM system associated)